MNPAELEKRLVALERRLRRLKAQVVARDRLRAEQRAEVWRILAGDRAGLRSVPCRQVRKSRPRGKLHPVPEVQR